MDISQFSKCYAVRRMKEADNLHRPSTEFF